MPKSLGVDASGRGARTPGAPFALAGLLLHVVRAASPLVGPLVYYALFTGLLLSALSIVLDQPVGTLVDNALAALPALLHALQLLPYTPTGPLVLSPLARSMLLVPLRLPSAMLAAALLYLLLVPGFDLIASLLTLMTSDCRPHQVLASRTRLRPARTRPVRLRDGLPRRGARRAVLQRCECRWHSGTRLE